MGAIGLGLGLELTGRRSNAAPEETPFRVHALGVDEAYWIGPHPTLGAIAHRMRRNVGFAGGSDMGPPYGVWRRTGSYALAGVEDDPTGARTVFAEESGAFDYAFFATAAAKFGGSVHGGEESLGSSGVDLAVSHLNAGAALQRSSRISYGAGVIADVDLTLEIGADGTLTESIAATFAGQFGQQYAGMEFGSGQFTRASVDGGGSWADISGIAEHDLGSAGSVMLRNPATGQTIQVESDAPGQPGYVRTFVRRQASLAKLYFEYDGASAIAASRTISFGASAPDPTPLFAKDFADGVLSPFTKLQGANAAIASGALEMTNDGASDTRYIAPMNGLEVGTQYSLSVLRETIGHAHTGAYVLVSSAGNGSINSPAGGGLISTTADPIIFTASAATMYVLLRQAGASNWLGNKVRWKSFQLAQAN